LSVQGSQNVSSVNSTVFLSNGLLRVNLIG
jgi:hypothetical protein